MIKLLLERFTGRIRFIFRNFPLAEVHPHALQAAEAAECAGGQGKFWPMHDLLFDNQSHLKPHQLRGYAERLQLDMGRYDLEMDDHVYLQRVREHMQSGRDSGVRGYPGVLSQRQDSGRIFRPERAVRRGGGERWRNKLKGRGRQRSRIRTGRPGRATSKA